ncbi:hypothetical protein PESP_a3368 [Pseudoalteromonas espejiana DSM 9414]|uniref:Uncharacterized protein n=1 Tax=Pseudoalteromonas espejiana TaxID=28107 RepID=A0A510XRX1_9GAMM|nr:hypothetical protein PESP_a3368 [Pseudoalteromonas espejiana DSM 9414]GEK53784.1 hypothetical protein PES01_06290 [Pseudoalteromonas espejiana]
MISKEEANPLKNKGPEKSYKDLEDVQLENDVLKKVRSYFDSLEE